jgi:hypothetical protein
MSHTINLGNYESTKPFLSASTEIGRGETMMVAAKRLWAEMAPVYAVILMREVKNGAVLSSQGAEAFAKLLLESVMGIEGS